MSLLSLTMDWMWLALGLLPLGAAVGGGDGVDADAAPAGAPAAAPPSSTQAAAQPAPANPDWDEDHQLVRAVLDGDGTAYRGLVERYQGRIYAVCYGMVRNREDARDMAQEAFVKAFKNLSRFRFGASFYTWLCRIAMNVSIDHLRRQKVRRAEQFDEGIATKDSAGVISLAHHRHSPSRDLERKRLHGRILEALDELPDEQKQVVVLREIEGLAYKEIAEIMDIPEGTVMSRLYYARKKLQKALGEDHA
jgi:RNA polymerase sigma-70 factor, ECF subfamily